MTIARAVPEPLPDSPDPVEIAMDMERGDRRPDNPARLLLIDQRRLIRSQITSERMGVALKVLTAIAGVLAVGVLAIMALQASRTDQLVLQPFSVPPDLAARGLTGPVVATKLRDQLAAMQANKLSNRAPNSYADDWSETPEIEIPQTGVSLSELQLALRNWLGRETRISGEVVRTPIGYQVTARAGAEPGQSFVGAEAELDTTIRRAAEAVYRMTQPDRHAGWLAETGKRDEAAKLYQELSIQGSRKDRAWVLAEWAGLEREAGPRLARARQAQALDRDHPVAAVHVSQALKELGRSTDSLAAHRRSAELLTGGRAEDLAPWWAALHAKEHEAEAAALLGNYAEAARLNDAASEPAADQPPLACSNCSSYAALMSGRDRARNHDPAGAGAETERAGSIFPEAAVVFRLYPGILMANAAEDWPATLAWAARTGATRGEADRTKYDKWMVATYQQSIGRYAVPAMLAEALARTGRVQEARALLGSTPPDCDPCLRARGLVEAIGGNARASEDWFVRAVARGRGLPGPYQDLGRARLARGDAAGALRAFRVAARRGPRWADPFKGEGDALARLGRHGDAVRAYAEAAGRAPRWAGLHMAWSRSLARLGRLPEARARQAIGARLETVGARAMALAALPSREPPGR